MKFSDPGKSYSQILAEKETKLVELGAERLAEALISLCEINEAAQDLVERLVSTPKENLKRFRAG